MREELLYHIWKLKRFDFDNLTTTDGKSIQILNGGHRNDHSGPDFIQAKIKIGKEIWAGHVEMHISSSDWLKHKHNTDNAYQNVILHVVYEEDTRVTLPNGEPLACLVLKDRIHQSTITSFEKLMSSTFWIPCEKNNRTLPPIELRSMYERVLVERLIHKTNRIKKMLVETENDWEEIFYRLLARNFGFKVNSDAFEALAYSLPKKILSKHKDKLKHLEALLYGQAGLLDKEFTDNYPLELKKEYTFFRKKYHLEPLQHQVWKFMRMRPANFPTIRLAQFSLLFFRTTHLFSKMLAARSVKEIANMFESEVSSYWLTHYTFDQLSPKRSKKLGKSAIRLLIINTVTPIIFQYGQVHQNQDMQERALDLLEQLPSEKNQIIKKFNALNFPAKTAFDSQALLELKTHYCDRKKCLHCAIGSSVLNVKSHS